MTFLESLGLLPFAGWVEGVGVGGENLSTKIAGFSVSVPGFPTSCFSNEMNWPSSCLLLVSVLLSWKISHLVASAADCDAG